MNTIKKYLQLFEDFLGDKIDVFEFEEKYLNFFKNEHPLPDDIFLILDKLFGDVDAFCPYPDLFEPSDLNEHDLRESVKDTLEKLLPLLASPPTTNGGSSDQS